MNYIQVYWNAIESGEVMVSKRVYRHYKRLVEDIAKPCKYVFDEDKANKPIEFIERFCKQSKGEWAGKPSELERF
ncbi:hypothetical protein [Bacillus thuringiensis]|uniref:hypothetical protein n=1 Tax=Bacillus thuringiensis TaxID=1428 RepID=UPI002852624B|nr:hypothetical protein [Bacillus thuringiensis]